MWEVNGKEVRAGGLTVVTLPNRSMAALGKFRYEEVAKQDADRLRLVAAAPELLEALEAVMSMDVKGHALRERLEFSTSGRELLGKVKAAITKAKGE